jgi:3-oxoacyl-[acyl-carrier protein] reductase
MKRLKNKVAIVTGGGSGFGAGICQRFADEGAKVIVADLDAARAVAVAEGCQDAVGCEADVSHERDVKEMIKTAVKNFGGLDILVNNAGVPQRRGSMLDVDEETFDRIFAVNVKSIYLTAKHAVPELRKRGGGSIINTASTAGVRPKGGLTWYAGSKGAVITITKAMAQELATDKIRVNATSPIIADTGMTVEFMGGTESAAQREAWLNSVPLGRLCEPRDVADATLYLASEDAAFISGVCLEVNGGRCV